ncbi:rhodanese-like domain-containing protein [Streptomyces sp. SL13]|jgi:rhodanese-related sulfurtransferase|uniref:Rhodanese-like domain-containing protein n=1 Tax=Streptantibioticus silvisoli TaxID=2705255 RepID=A0AA90H210_9ACTN|nr:rhodanese-like domain-containing protein [Streptantibioticus silvisoli]MDI5964302.1 rhodanese-like domain-containing protein [Streptantibioticus silvisoli]MDI5970596.1 rhodanese-like domain-containing protein [Streptantibioticus silvisoli]
MSFAPMPSIDVTALPADGFLLDVRESDEWQAGHAPAATHIAMSEITARHAEVPTDSRVHVICKAGGRSAQVTQFLIDQGVDAVNVDGGMLAWQACGHPMVSENGTAAGVL